MAEPTPDDFLLSSKRGQSAEYPIRKGIEVTPLRGGQATFAAMEAAIAGAKRYVYLAAWTFQPSLPCVSGVAKTWKDLLQKAGARADVRLLLNYMDPVNSSYHRRAWAAYRDMIVVAAQVAKKAQKNGKRFEVICSLHEAALSLVELPKNLLDPLNAALRKQKLDMYSHIRRNLSSADLKNMPLLWKNVRYDPRQGFVLANEIELTVHIATHHQKLCIVDGEVGFCGGIDVTAGRVGKGWRDVHCQVKGAVVADLEASFASRWNDEMPKFREFVESANALLTDVMKVKKFELPLRRNTKVDVKPATPRKSDPGKAFAQVHRTMSAGGSLLGLVASSAQGTPSIVSEPVAVEIRDAYLRAISNARRYIYIENQYLREPALADAIIERLDALGTDGKLQVILVVPAGVEEKDKIITPYGNFLQAQSIARVKKAFEDKGAGKNFGAFSTIGSYVHSKVMIVDDVFATIGSANGNPRGFELDTELNVSWCEAASVKKLREDLWSSLLGSPKDFGQWPASDYAKKWTGIANAKSGAIRHHKSRPGDGSLAFLIPNALV